ncbi:MAG: hypothetical protein ABWY05_05245 [Noviherbaspirillum sp.]
MSQHYLDAVVQSSSAGLPHAGMLEQALPFTVRVVRDEADLMKAVQIRQAAYGRHLPEFAQTLRLPEALDMRPGVVVLLAESKLDGMPLGSMRIQTNCCSPLALEQSLTLPADLTARPLAEATRLGVTGHRVGRMVKTLLFKAFFQYCQQQGIEWMVIAGRSPIDRQYERLLFSDVYLGMGAIALRHAGNIPHRVMSFEVGSAERRWREAGHPLYDLVFRTAHADIDLGHASPAFQPVHQQRSPMREHKMAA